MDKGPIYALLLIIRMGILYSGNAQVCVCVCVLPLVALMLSHVLLALNLNRNYWAYSLVAEYSTAVASPSERTHWLYWDREE